MSILFLKHEIHYLINKLLGVNNLTRNRLEDWLAGIDVEAERVLDVGVGFTPAKNRVRKFKAKEYKTLDNNSENEIKPHFTLDLNLLDDKNTVKKIKDYSPNVVFCLEVMEYIYRPDAVLKFFHKVLAEKGILYLSFHTFYPWHKPYKNDYLRYTKSGVMKLLAEAGFSKWEIIPRKATKGRKDLWTFFRKEGLIGFRDKINLDIGYLVKAYR